MALMCANPRDDELFITMPGDSALDEYRKRAEHTFRQLLRVRFNTPDYAKIVKEKEYEKVYNRIQEINRMLGIDILEEGDSRGVR